MIAKIIIEALYLQRQCSLCLVTLEAEFCLFM